MLWAYIPNWYTWDLFFNFQSKQSTQFLIHRWKFTDKRLLKEWKYVQSISVLNDEWNGESNWVERSIIWMKNRLINDYQYEKMILAINL